MLTYSKKRCLYVFTTQLRSLLLGQLDELERLYEEFRRLRRCEMEERALREKVEGHLEQTARGHEAWRARSDFREQQLAKARSEKQCDI